MRPRHFVYCAAAGATLAALFCTGLVLFVNATTALYDEPDPA